MEVQFGYIGNIDPEGGHVFIEKIIGLNRPRRWSHVAISGTYDLWLIPIEKKVLVYFSSPNLTKA